MKSEYSANKALTPKTKQTPNCATFRQRLQFMVNMPQYTISENHTPRKVKRCR